MNIGPEMFLQKFTDDESSGARYVVGQIQSA